MRIFGCRGFSLLELVFVVAILGLLAGVAMPRFRTYQSQNKRKEATNNLNQIYFLMQTKFQEDNRYDTISSAQYNNIVFGRTGVKQGNCDFGSASKWASKIGFKIDPCVNNTTSLPIYQYRIESISRNAFTASACDTTGVVSICTGTKSGFRDYLKINQTQTISIACNGILCTDNSCSLPSTCTP